VPELPEVETVRRGIAPHVVGRRITRLVVRESRLRWPVDPELAAQLVGRRITRTERRGKYLLLPLDSGDCLIVHLGMSGRLYVLDAGHPLQKHDHVDLALDDGALLRLHDPRRFGALLLWRAADPVHPLLLAMGPEPLADAEGAEPLAERLYRLSRGRRLAVKNFIMDGRIVVGAGNIYAAEALFRAGIRPTRAAGRITRPGYARLTQAIRQVLDEAISAGGTSFRDFRGSDGSAGYFQQDLYVYGRDGLPCRICDTPIRLTVIGARASCWCPLCQR
jgi:formamidopyrimidine-DNA glycosylase